MTISSSGWRDGLLARVHELYTERFPRSAEAYARAQRYLVDGGSHPARMFEPYAFRIVEARGSRVRDLDGCHRAPGPGAGRGLGLADGVPR